MRWLVVHPGPNFSVSDVASGWVEALRELGEHVVVYNLDDRLAVYDSLLMDMGSTDDDGRPLIRKAFTRDQAIELASSGILSACYRLWPDVVLLVSAFFTPAELLDIMRARRHKVVTLFTECPYQDDEQLERGAHADLNLLNDPVSLPAFRQLGIPAEYVPHAYRPALHKPGPPDPDLAADLAFVGTGFRSRIDFFERMGLGGLDVLLAGNWQLIKDKPESPLHKYLAHDIDDCLSNEQTVRVYNSARAGVNFYRREALEGDSADGVAMGPREVEMCASQLFFLRDHRPEGDALLHMLPTFASPEDAGEQLRWYLEHDEIRNDLARQARAAIADRTFVNNAKMLLRLLDRQPVTL